MADWSGRFDLYYTLCQRAGAGRPRGEWPRKVENDFIWWRVPSGFGNHLLGTEKGAEMLRALVGMVKADRWDLVHATVKKFLSDIAIADLRAAVRDE